MGNLHCGLYYEKTPSNWPDNDKVMVTVYAALPRVWNRRKDIHTDKRRGSLQSGEGQFLGEELLEQALSFIVLYNCVVFTHKKKT